MRGLPSHLLSRLPVTLITLVTLGCSGPKVDLTQALQVQVVTAGWYDAGIVGNQNKLVPALKARLKNNSNQVLPVLQMNVLFRQVNAKEEWGSSFLPITGAEGLAPGATTGTLLLRSQNGYTGSGESRQEMLENSHFVDAKAEIFAKYDAIQWVKVGEHQIPRQLLTN